MNRELLDDIERLKAIDLTVSVVKEEDSYVYQLKKEIERLNNQIMEHEANEKEYRIRENAQRKADGKKNIFNSVVANLISGAIGFIASSIFYNWDFFVSLIQDLCPLS